MTRTWIAAVVAAGLLIGGGVAGYAIGAANDRHGHGPGWHDQRGQGRDFPRGDGDWRGGGDWNR
jgi:hypothetical protein